MKHQSRLSEEFLSDDGRLALFMELEDGQISRVTLARKDKEFADISGTEFKVFAELFEAAKAYAVKPVAEG